ncbi:hypothetical protein TNCV_1282271 [Trichonephila clavipes]|uniref:Uncharacterized protein n=1 Tax=Trichonephila clavipes TaxID=2585209 RepID=A0A8X6VPE8_TRICX|nr:hypothetical protein TNCV_1282271 [Trichonephila clavipes]
MATQKPRRHIGISLGVTVWGAMFYDIKNIYIVVLSKLAAKVYISLLTFMISTEGDISHQDNVGFHTVSVTQRAL